jgi:predicted small secreted protein
MRILFSLLVILSVAMPLAACNTIEGAGQDISKGGQAIAGAARDVRG